MNWNDFTVNNSILFVISNVLTAFITTKITLWLADRKENLQGKIRFRNRLICLAHELKMNFKDVGNIQSPFQTKALEKLVHDEALIHQHPDLFLKAHNCLNVALKLSTSSQTNLRPGNGQGLMRELSEYLKNFHAINIDSSN